MSEGGSLNKRFMHLDRYSGNKFSNIETSMTPVVHEEISSAITDNDVVIVMGPLGIGKSSVVGNVVGSFCKEKSGTVSHITASRYGTRFSDELNIPKAGLRSGMFRDSTVAVVHEAAGVIDLILKDQLFRSTKCIKDNACISQEDVVKTTLEIFWQPLVEFTQKQVLIFPVMDSRNQVIAGYYKEVIRKIAEQIEEQGKRVKVVELSPWSRDDSERLIDKLFCKTRWNKRSGEPNPKATAAKELLIELARERPWFISDFYKFVEVMPSVPYEKDGRTQYREVNVRDLVEAVDQKLCAYLYSFVDDGCSKYVDWLSEIEDFDRFSSRIKELILEVCKKNTERLKDLLYAVDFIFSEESLDMERANLLRDMIELRLERLALA